jgi:hypothetical protein
VYGACGEILREGLNKQWNCAKFVCVFPINEQKQQDVFVWGELNGK